MVQQMKSLKKVNKMWAREVLFTEMMQGQPSKRHQRDVKSTWNIMETHRRGTSVNLQSTTELMLQL